MTASNRPQFAVGPLRVGTSDVLVATDCADFARVARRVFADLARLAQAPAAVGTVQFETIRHHQPTLHWSIHRDGRPCELQLRHDAVLTHLQWELNRLAIELHPCSIHAAAVAVDGGAAVLAGASHSGKSTLAGWLVAHHRAGYVADEVSSIDGRGRVVPFTRPLGVRPDSPLLAAAGGLDGAEAEFMPEERLVPIVDLVDAGEVVVDATPVRLLVFPRFHRRASTTMRRLPEADALERVAALTPGLAQHGRVVFDRLSTLVASTPTIEVGYSQVADAADVVYHHLIEAGRP